MSEERSAEEAPRLPKASRLRAALDRARQQEVERSDVIVDLREAELARLELLQDALGDVFDEIPQDNDLLGCTLIPGTPPRLWVDVLAHVVMGRDKRTYRFVKDTRYGRQVILETASLDEMAARVTDYVAHRLIERERAVDSDAAGVAATPNLAAIPEAPAVARRPGRFGWLGVAVAFLFGVLVGAVGLFGLGLALVGP